MCYSMSVCLSVSVSLSVCLSLYLCLSVSLCPCLSLSPFLDDPTGQSVHCYATEISWCVVHFLNTNAIAVDEPVEPSFRFTGCEIITDDKAVSDLSEILQQV